MIRVKFFLLRKHVMQLVIVAFVLLLLIPTFHINTKWGVEVTRKGPWRIPSIPNSGLASIDPGQTYTGPYWYAIEAGKSTSCPEPGPWTTSDAWHNTEDWDSCMPVVCSRNKDICGDGNPPLPHGEVCCRKGLRIPCCVDILTHISGRLLDFMERMDIPYVAVVGTHLGAMRSNGWVPWTADADFGIPDDMLSVLAHNSSVNEALGRAGISLFEDATYHMGRACVNRNDARLLKWNDCSRWNHNPSERRHYVHKTPYIDLYCGYLVPVQNYQVELDTGWGETGLDKAPSWALHPLVFPPNTQAYFEWVRCRFPLPMLFPLRRITVCGLSIPCVAKPLACVMHWYGPGWTSPPEEETLHHNKNAIQGSCDDREFMEARRQRASGKGRSLPLEMWIVNGTLFA